MKKRFNIGAACRKTMCRCNALSDIELECSLLPIPKNIAKFIPPLHEGCDCIMVNIEDSELTEMEAKNEERKTGGEIGIYKTDAIGVMVRGENSDKIYQVIIDKDQEVKLLKYIRDLHRGIIKCFDVPLVGINLNIEKDK